MSLHGSILNAKGKWSSVPSALGAVCEGVLISSSGTCLVVYSLVGYLKFMILAFSLKHQALVCLKILNLRNKQI